MNTLSVEIKYVDKRHEEQTIVYTEGSNGLDIGYKRLTIYATVSVNGSDTRNDFDVTCDDEWADFGRNRNTVTIVIDKNPTLTQRDTKIRFTHKLDSDVYVDLVFWQAPCEYTIAVNPSHIPFDTLLDDKFYKELSRSVTVTTNEGMRDFGVGPIIEYARNFTENSVSDYYVIPYDHGLKLTKIDKNHLRITTYGKVCLYDDYYYILTLYHINNPRSTAQIRVEFDDALLNNETGLGFEDD